jgi:hypothetical protein
MTELLCNMLRVWADECSSALNEDGFVVLLETADESTAIESVLTLESRKYSGRLILKETGETLLDCTRSGSGKTWHAKCSVFVREDLDAALAQLLERMGEGETHASTERKPVVCPDRKPVFLSRRQARTAVEKWNMIGRMHPYQCQHCSEWHIEKSESLLSAKKRYAKH